MYCVVIFQYTTRQGRLVNYVCKHHIVLAIEVYHYFYERVQKLPVKYIQSIKCKINKINNKCIEGGKKFRIANRSFEKSNENLNSVKHKCQSETFQKEC